MIIIHHRRNTIELLEATPEEYGVEVDVRSEGGRLIIHHDPFASDGDFETWLKRYRHRLLALNVKESGLEPALLDLMEKYGIEDFFFLDQTFSYILETVRKGEPRCAVRYSEYESIDTALALQGQVKWVWVDVLTRLPLTKEEEVQLHDAGFSIYLVSDELLGRPASAVASARTQLEKAGIEVDAVCTKYPELWQ